MPSSVNIKNLPDDLWAQVKILALQRGVLVRNIVEEALVFYLDAPKGGGEKGMTTETETETTKKAARLAVCLILLSSFSIGALAVMDTWWGNGLLGLSMAVLILSVIGIGAMGIAGVVSGVQQEEKK